MRVMLVAGVDRRREGATRDVWAGNRDRMVFLKCLVMVILHKFN